MSVVSIKSVPAVSNAAGTHEKVLGYYHYGSATSPVLYPYYGTSWRGSLSYNPVTNVGGIPWRNPSSYSRAMRVFEDVRSSKTNRALAYRVPGSNPTGMVLLTNYPEYWTNLSPNEAVNLKNEADTRALNKVASRKASLGVSIGESMKAASMIATTSSTLWLAYKAARRGQFDRVQRLLGLNDGDVLKGLFPANRWLEYQYGWKPLLTDLHAQYGIVQNGLAADNFLIYGKGGASRSSKVENTLYDTGHNITYSRKWEAAQFVVTNLTCKLSSQRWRDAGRIGLLNPLEIAWELTPFSFVIDWFCPIGNVLEALTARAGLSFVGGTRTIVTGGECRVEALSSSNVLYEKGRLKMRFKAHNRYKLATLPFPAVYFDESPFSNLRTLNALALWRSIQSGRGIPAHIRA